MMDDRPSKISWIARLGSITSSSSLQNDETIESNSSSSISDPTTNLNHNINNNSDIHNIMTNNTFSTIPPSSSSSSSLKRRNRYNSILQKKHDSTYSVSDEYNYNSTNDLSIWNGAALLTADCLGTGLLALPHDINVLGYTLGMSFLILQLPINLYAGTILSNAANYVETKQNIENETQILQKTKQDMLAIIIDGNSSNSSDNIVDIYYHDENDIINSLPNTEQNHLRQQQQQQRQPTIQQDYKAISIDNRLVYDNNDNDDEIEESLHHDTATFDFIGMTSTLFYNNNNNKICTKWVMILYYTNIFLVLGNYIVVMSHAVSALIGEDILCIPTAGLFASSLMFAVSQLRTMAKLGRSASIISLSALMIVIIQCLYFAQHPTTTKYDNNGHDNVTHTTTNDDDNVDSNNENERNDNLQLLRKLSAMGSIGFAVGSQKLFLNIRHEFADRNKAPQSLALALTGFGTFYVLIVLAAGNDPPGFLFDSVPSHTIHRRIAGFFLWVHVVVSYAINSQAICSSMDRIFFYQWTPVRHWPDHRRWMLLTGVMAATAFFVANAIPFFKDLVAFIGALTSVPLTLLLPAIFHRRVQAMPIWLPTTNSLASYSLLIFSTIFMVTATLGSISSILSDWEHHTGGFFSCH